MRTVPVPLFAALLLDIDFLQGALIGAGSGAMVGRLLVHQIEKRRGELSPARIRQVEIRWSSLGVIVMSIFSPL